MNDVKGPAGTDRRPAPQRNNRPQLVTAAVATATVLVVMATIFWALAYNRSPGATEAQPADVSASPQPSPMPTPATTPRPTAPAVVETPPAPPQNQLSSNDWLLSPYAVIREEGKLVVTGELRNNGDVPRSGTVRVFVYVAGDIAGVGTGEVRDVPAGGKAEVILPSGSTWMPGNKILLVDVQDID